MEQSRELELWLASTEGNLQDVKNLLSEPTVSVNWVPGDQDSNKGDSPFHRACRFGHLSIVKEFVSCPRVELNKGNDGRSSPFYIACQEGHRDVVEFLLGYQDINVNHENFQSCTPLLFACQQGHKDVVLLLLLDHRVDCNKVQHTN